MLVIFHEINEVLGNIPTGHCMHLWLLVAPKLTILLILGELDLLERNQSQKEPLKKDVGI